MTFLSDQELSKSRASVVRRMRRETMGWSHLFRDGRDGYNQWLLGLADEAISVGLSDMDKFDPSRSELNYWFYLKARRLAFRDIKQEENHLKLLKKLAQEARTQETAEDPFGKFLLDGELEAVLEDLSAIQLQALGLVYLVGFSHQETAFILKKKRNAVDALLYRARDKAREVYRKNRDSRKESSDSSDNPRPRPRSTLSGPDDDDASEGILGSNI
jgi:RNA polymerase sigma factor (sigma-70 family)